MNTYEFVLAASTDLENETLTIVISTGPDWVSALAKIDPDCKMYMVTSKTLPS